MAPRLELQRILETFGAARTYFQPPDGSRMEYPAIVYSLDRMDIDHANDNTYSVKNRYQITVIDSNPDSEIPNRVAHLPKTSFQARFTKDRLNHTVFTTYF